MSGLFAIYDTVKRRYVTYDPTSEQYRLVYRIADLRSWDVWDEDMIPYILQEKGIKSRYSVRELSERAIKKLTFHPL